MEEFETAQESPMAEIRKPSPLVAIDKSGDLNLCVGADHTDEPTTFVVCSKTLARSSPVLKTMLYGRFAESNRPKESHDDWVVDLPDDEPEALAVFLNIIHSNFHEIPRKPNVCSVYNLLVVLDKYDCIALVQPWASSWVRLIKDTSNVALLLCIALELGAADLFRTTFSKIINHCSLDSKDRLVYTGPSHDLSPYSPNRAWMFPHENYEHLGLFELVKTTRQDMLSTVAKPYFELYQRLFSAKGLCRHEGVAPTAARMKCDNMLLKGLISSCSAIGIDIRSRDSLRSYEGTVEKLRISLKGIQFCVPKFHQTCEVRLKSITHETTYHRGQQAQRENRLLDLAQASYQARMKTQAKKSGIERAF